jgi:lipopolysaccharide/colanic/teichoic acid biosynthesis glycosyltransferase
MVTPSRPLYRFTKRALDLFYVLLLLPILGPIMLAVWALVRVRMGRPVFFRQVRPGLNARPFVIHKFRSMIDAIDVEGRPLPDKERLTPLGRLLRRSSLDELPQIWNVLKGEMSFVGPRPLLMEYVPRYTPEQRRRLDVKPGITGLAQIAGRNTLGWEDRLSLDVKYVDQASLSLDHLILLRTVKKVLCADGVPSTGLDPNEKFQGTPDVDSISAGNRDKSRPL